MSKERQLRKQKEIRNTILDAARKIVTQDGVQGLSIRKITNAIGYSPGIIYHYFNDKNEIVEIVMNEGYGRILASIRQVERNEEEPEKEIEQAFRNNIKSVFSFSEEYKAFILNDDPSILKKTGVLERGICDNSPTMKALSDVIQRGMDQGRFAPGDSELTAQILWTSVFGLIIKLMMEKDVPQEQIDRLIDHHFTVLFNGIMTRKEE